MCSVCFTYSCIGGRYRQCGASGAGECMKSKRNDPCRDQCLFVHYIRYVWVIVIQSVRCKCSIIACFLLRSLFGVARTLPARATCEMCAYDFEFAVLSVCLNCERKFVKQQKYSYLHWFIKNSRSIYLIDSEVIMITSTEIIKWTMNIWSSWRQCEQA